MSEDFIEHALEGSLAIEVWGHRSGGFNTSSKPGWEIDNINAKSRSLADRWVFGYQLLCQMCALVYFILVVVCWDLFYFFIFREEVIYFVFNYQLIDLFVINPCLCNESD